MASFTQPSHTIVEQLQHDHTTYLSIIPRDLNRYYLVPMLIEWYLSNTSARYFRQKSNLVYGRKIEDVDLLLTHLKYSQSADPIFVLPIYLTLYHNQTKEVASKILYAVLTELKQINHLDDMVHIYMRICDQDKPLFCKLFAQGLPCGLVRAGQVGQLINTTVGSRIIHCAFWHSVRYVDQPVCEMLYPLIENTDIAEEELLRIMYSLFRADQAKFFTFARWAIEHTKIFLWFKTVEPKLVWSRAIISFPEVVRYDVMMFLLNEVGLIVPFNMVDSINHFSQVHYGRKIVDY